MANEKELNIKLKFTTEGAGANQAAQNVEKVKKGAGESNTSVKGLDASLQRIGKTSDVLRTAGAALTVSFGAMSAGLLASAKNYVQSVGTGEQSSRRWLGANKEIEQANLRIGRVLASETVPYLEKAAELAERFADFSEKNPGLIGGIAAIAGGGTLLGGGAVAAGTVMSGFKNIAKALGMGGAAAAGASAAGAGAAGAAGAGAAGAAGAAGGAAVAGFVPVLASVLAGLGIGSSVNNAISQTDFGKRAGFQPTNKALTVGAYGLGSMLGGEETGLAWAKGIGQATGAIQKQTVEQSKAGHEIDFTSQQIAAYIGYMRQEQQAERARGIQLQRMQRDFARQERIDVDDFNKQRGRSLRDFHRSEMIAEQDYYRQRAIRSRDFGIEMVRAEEDFQRSRKRAAEDFEFEMWDVLRSGDALAWMRANRQYNIQRQREEEDFQIQQQRKNEDFSREMADQAREFNISRKRRMEEFAIRIKDENEDFAIRRKRAREQYAIQLADNERDYNEQRLLRRQALIDQMRDLTDGLERERLMRQEFTRAMLADLQGAINSSRSGTNLIQGSRAVGGYVDAGLYRMHPREFVMDRNTTEAYERAAGGSLDQSRLLGLITQGGGTGSGRQIVWNDHRQFDGTISAQERELIRQDTLQIIEEVTNA